MLIAERRRRAPTNVILASIRLFLGGLEGGALLFTLGECKNKEWKLRASQWPIVSGWPSGAISGTVLGVFMVSDESECHVLSKPIKNYHKKTVSSTKSEDAV